MGYQCQVLCLFIFLLFSQLDCFSWGWFASTEETRSSSKQTTDSSRSNFVAEFSMEGLSNDKGMKRVENARGKLAGLNSCWQNAYQNLFAGCAKIVSDEEKRSRLAWHLSDCFQKDSGRPPFPFCDTKSAMVNCLKKLNDIEHQVYLEFVLETNSICYQLQSHAFKSKIESLVNDLKNSAEYTEEQLEVIKERITSLLQSSDEIQDSLSTINLRVQNVAQTTKDIEDGMDVLSKHSEAVNNRSREIANAQAELQREQVKMNKNLEEGMETIHDAYTSLGKQVDTVKNEAVEIEKQIGRVGETITSKMQNLQNTADNIEDKAGRSLDKQQQLLEGQSTTLEGLQLMTDFQSKALEESRSTLQRLAEYGHRQQEELLQRQNKLQQVHGQLVENSKSILEAQEAFESKQASMFVALEKLFALHNAILLESRIIKAFFIYSISIFIIYMFTSTKQTYRVRATLYIGLCATFSTEVGILWITTNNIERQTWIINLVRSIFVLLASFQFLHAICTYRDYEVLNHNMILALMEKVNAIQRNEEPSECDMDWHAWVVDDLPEEVDYLEDPDYLLPEEVAENSITTSSMTRRYNLRKRSCS